MFWNQTTFVFHFYKLFLRSLSCNCYVFFFQTIIVFRTQQTQKTISLHLSISLYLYFSLSISDQIGTHFKEFKHTFSVWNNDHYIDSISFSLLLLLLLLCTICLVFENESVNEIKIKTKPFELWKPKTKHQKINTKKNPFDQSR